MNDGKRLQDRTRVIDLGAADVKLARPSSSCAHLLVIRGQSTDMGRVLAINSTITIGRNRSSDLPLTDPRVSSRHARISPQQPDSYVLTDLKSTNGTRVDGKPISASWNLRDGEKIFVGETVLRFTEASDTDLVYLRDPVMQTGTDSLTGLEPKRRFDDALDKALVSARLIKSPLALLAMDLDNLGAIGELHGHPFSTQCIREAGRIIGKKIGYSGYACRYGGDDFVAFLKGVKRQDATHIAEGIRAAIESADIRKEGIALHPTISIGIAVFPEDGDWVLDLTAVADQALYRAKAAGKNRVVAR